jgi:hypothetical protein
MKLLSKMNEIKFEHIEKFCDTLIDIQNNLSREFKYIDISLFKMKNVKFFKKFLFIFYFCLFFNFFYFFKFFVFFS